MQCCADRAVSGDPRLASIRDFARDSDPKRRSSRLSRDDAASKRRDGAAWRAT
jgi:hypothetical protein